MIRRLMQSLVDTPLTDEGFNTIELVFDPLPTLLRWTRQRAKLDAMPFAYYSLWEFNAHLPADYANRIKLEGRISKRYGVRFSLNSLVRSHDEQSFIDVTLQKHELPCEFIRVQPKDLQDGHLALGAAYKDYSYPPSGLLWATSSQFQSEGWVCSKFNFDKEADKLEIEYVEPERKKETVTIKVNFKVMKDDLEFINRPPPEPEPEWKWEDLYHQKHNTDVDGFELGQFGLYNPLLVGGTIHWVRVDPDEKPYPVDTTYIRFAEWMMRDRFMLETIRVFDVYANAGIDFVQVAKLHMTNRDIGEEFNQLYQTED